MVDASFLLSQAGYALGTLGGMLVFVELFQTPSYVEYNPDWDSWNVQVSPPTADEYTAAGRIGAVCIALAFALQFVAGLL